MSYDDILEKGTHAIEITIRGNITVTDDEEMTVEEALDFVRDVNGATVDWSIRKQ